MSRTKNADRSAVRTRDLAVRTSPAELAVYKKRSKKERKAYEQDTKKAWSFSAWVRWKLLRLVDKN